MHFGIIAQGSRGDVQPMIALGLSLKNEGHQATILAPENFDTFVKGFDLPFIPLEGDIEEMARSPKALELLKGGNILRFLFYYNKETKDINALANQKIYEASNSFDGIIGGSLSVTILHSIAEKLNKKYAVIFPSMPCIPTKEFPMPMINAKIPYALNKASYKLGYLVWLLQKKQTNSFRKKIGLPLINIWNAFLEENTLTFFTLGETLVSKPKDWPSNAHITGMFKLPEKSRQQHAIDKTPEGLSEWIQNGKKPIYIGFGSIPIPDTEKFSSILNRLLENTEERIILGLGWSIIPNLPEHNHLFVVKYVNHDWLFPQCKLAINHGGIGSVGAVLRAGIPLLIISIIADQPYNGKLITEKKVGLHIPFTKINYSKLKNAIEQLQQRSYVKNAKILSQQMKLEDGVNDATNKIIQYFSS